MFKKKFDFVTVGGATRDFMFYDPKAEFLYTPEDIKRQASLCFTYGSKIQVDKTYFTFGGGAANTAVNLARQGLKVSTIVAVGDDEIGHSVYHNFLINGVNTDLIAKKVGKMTGFSFILTAGKEKEHVIFVYRGASSFLTVDDSLLKKINTKWFYLASLSGSNWKRVLDLVTNQQSFIAWNPGSSQLQAGHAVLK